MSDLLTGLVVLAIGGSTAPPLLLLTILFLGSQIPLPNAGALMLGYFTTCAVIGISGITLFGRAEDAVSTVGRVISVTVGVLLLVLGLRTVLAPPDPDSTPPKWMESIDSMSPPRAFGFGMVLFPLQVKNLAIFVACLNLIIAESLGSEGSIVALGLVLLILRHPGSRAHRPLCGRSATRLEVAGVSADVDGEEQPYHHGRNMPRIRSILPPQRFHGSVRTWAIVGAELEEAGESR